MFSPKIRYFLYGTIASASIVSIFTYASGPDGVFGDYFQNMINDAVTCGATKVVTGFDTAPGINYGKQKCTTFQNVVNTALKTFGSAPLGQAVTGFDSTTGNPIYGDVNWHRSGSDISYTAGNVGIGTNTPITRLDIRGNAANQTTLRVTANDGSSIATGWPAGWGGGIQTWDILAMSAKLYARLDISGTPDSKIRLDKSSGTNWNYIEWLIGGVRKYWTGINNNGIFTIQSDTASAIALAPYGGNVGIGTTTPAYPLDINGHVVNNGWYVSRGANGWYNQAFGGGWYMSDSSWIRSYGGKYLYVDSIIQAGAYMNSPAYYYISDSRLKKDLTKIDSPLQKIEQLNGYYFKWKKDNKKDMGLIAQEVEKVFPDLVGEFRNPDDNNAYKNVEYGHLVAPIIEAIKELSKQSNIQISQNDSQQQEIDILKNELRTLKEEIEMLKKVQ